MARDRQQDAKATRIDEGLVARVVRGVRYMATGRIPDAWFGPLSPLEPVVTNDASVIGRQWDYPTGFNMRTQPRGEEAVSFELLRQFSDQYDLLRLVLETRKDEVSRLPWKIKSRGETRAQDADDVTLTAFFELPDREHSWDEWIRILLEDMFVIDAATIYPRMTKGGALYALEPVDGATIKRVIDEFGRTPIPPAPAYQQILKGVPAANYTRDELIYRPRNPRSHKVYGYSPVEQVILTVQTALRRSLSTLEYYTTGSVPDVFVGVPEAWSADQIRQFQEYWDQILSGDTAERRRARFVPGGLKITPMREPALKTWFDDWIARVICYAFSVDISTLVSQVNRATAETQRESAQKAGLGPIKAWIKTLIDYALAKYMQRPDKEFVWEIETSLTPMEQAAIHKIYVEAKVLHPDEVRDDIGLDPMTPEQREELAPKPAPAPAGPQEGAREGGQEGAAEEENEDEEIEASARGELAKAGKSLTHKPGAHTKAVRKVTAALHAAFRKHAARFSDFVAARLGKEDNVAGMAIVDEMDFEDLAAELLEAMSAEIAAVAMDSSDRAFDATEVEDLRNRDAARLLAARWAEERAAEMVRLEGDANIIDATRKGLAAIIAQAIRDGISATELGKLIGAAYAFSEDRARTIAITEMRRADIAGTLEGWKASGVVATKFWLTAGDEKVEQHCLDNEADGYIPINALFTSGDVGPPSHPNCRCSLLAGLKE